MAKAKIAVVIDILAVLQFSWTTVRSDRFGNIVAVMTVNVFQKTEDGGGTAACDGHFHSDDALIVALSSGWYAGGKRCSKTIHITSVDTGRTVKAQVVNECGHGCKNNTVHSSPAIWKKLGLHTDLGEVHVTWSDA